MLCAVSISDAEWEAMVLSDDHAKWNEIVKWRSDLLCVCYVKGTRFETHQCVHYAFCSPRIVDLTPPSSNIVPIMYPCCVTGRNDPHDTRKIEFHGFLTRPTAEVGVVVPQPTRSYLFFVSSTAMKHLVTPVHTVGNMQARIRQVRDIHRGNKQSLLAWVRSRDNGTPLAELRASMDTVVLYVNSLAFQPSPHQTLTNRSE